MDGTNPETTMPAAAGGNHCTASLARRRALFGAGTAALGVAALLAPAAEGDDRPATLHDYAAVTFKDQGPDIEAALGSREEWLIGAVSDYVTIMFAARLLRKNDDEVYKLVQHLGDETMCDLQMSLSQLHKRYEGLADILSVASVRALTGMARKVVLAGEA